METCRQAALCACAVSLAYGMLTQLLPTERFAKQLRLIMVLLLLIALIQPFLKQDFSLPALALQEDAGTGYSQTYRALLSRQTEEQLAETLSEQLNEAGIACQRIQVSIHIDEEDSISIREVRLQCADYPSAAALLRQSLGQDTRITEVEAW
ncbi:stage III sporulation protein AF [Ruminococcus sp.]|uniref:stage III sporulation protein AF n=1 Tax=Ruminococcus sp. TaxID=41978 RepID=UPI0025DFF2DC|nr:stage III sporulation protein AF [uncultured Ruminococcus sp.]